MAPLSLKVVQDDGAVTRKVKLDSKAYVHDALITIKEKFLTPEDGKEYGLFLTSADNELSGVWLESHRHLDYYMLRDGDQLYYLCKTRNLRLRMLDGTVKTLLVDESKQVAELMLGICGKIGITNHDEYGLCHDEEETDDGKPPGSYGTLTLKRVRDQKEKDVKLEQLSKKLKTDDNVQWLDQHKTLREMAVGPKQTLLLKRRLFYSDRNVDSRDPVQLNLLYVQARDAILDGRHPVTEDKAVEFAGIQCQIHYGDFREEIHKVGLIENLREYLPEQYASSWGVEKKIFKEHRKHQGISPIDAKYLYTKTARDLPTYGVTFFLVKEKQKGKKKLIPRLLGINANSILRLDEVTKEILQVWPLTQVKSYQVGKSETFTLNFGDYSDKEYSVKTNDAIRIRDILQGYIDIIGKRMAGAYNTNQSDHHTIGEDMIMTSRGNIIQHVGNNPSKIVEESFVGPTKIISYEPGQQAHQGTQLVTVQQIITTNLGSKEQFAVSGEVPVHKDMPMECVRKLNRMNSNSVKIVTELTDPNENGIKEAQKIFDTMEADLPLIITGIKEIAEKQSDKNTQKKLLDELQELRDNMNTLSTAIKGDNINTEIAQEAAKKIADLSTRMYFLIDPGTKKRGEFCRRSRNSFIRDEKKDAAMRRASFIAAAAGACSSVDDAICIIGSKYEGPKLEAKEEEQLEKAALDKMGKLNAAVALYLMAHADTANIDYSAGVTSMNTINELLPEIAKDTQVLSVCKNGAAQQALLDDMKHLFEATRLICSLTGCTDHEKIQEIATNYADVSGKLIFTLSRGGNDDRDNKIIELSKEVGNKTSLLLMKANELTALVPSNPAAADVDAAGVNCADAAKDLLACAMLTAPSIYEPHCQSALTAAVETLSSSAQKVIDTSKPIIDDPSRHHYGDELKALRMDLAKALDTLQNAYGNTKEEHDYKSPKQEKQRLKFIATIVKANKCLDAADKELRKPPVATRGSPASPSTDHMEKDLAQKIARINSAVATLITATSDHMKPDYVTAELALNTINEELPGIVKDTKTVSAGKNEDTRAAMLADITKLCEATRGICTSAELQNFEDLNGAATRFANTSNKLFYVFSPLTTDDRERKITDISEAACGKALKMLANVYQLAEDSTGDMGADLDGRGAIVADAAKALLTSAQLTAPCIEDPRCQSVLTNTADALSLSAHDLAKRWSPLLQESKHSTLVKQLNKEHDDLQQELDKLKIACQDIGKVQSDGVGEKLPNKEQQRLQYIISLKGAKDTMQAVDKEFNKPLSGALRKGELAVVRELQMSQRMAQINAALATLAAATSDRDNPDYAAAGQVLNTINELLPQIVKDTKVMAQSKDDKTRAAMMEDLRALIEATKGICNGTEIDPKKFNNLASKFANASSKLIYVVNPRAKPHSASQVIEMAQATCKSANQLVKDINKLASEVDVTAAVDLVQCGNNTNQAADGLFTVAQLAAPCVNEPRCQSALVSSAEKLGASAQELSRHWKLLQEPMHKPFVVSLEKKHQELLQDLDKLLSTCGKNEPVKRSDSKKKEQNKNQLIKTTADAKKAVITAQKELNKPVAGSSPKGEAAALQRHQLSQRLAQLNAAVAALVKANADRKNPDHVAAEEAVATIKELMPHVMKNANGLTAGKDETSRAATVAELRTLCQAAHDICDNVEKNNTTELNESAMKFANTSNKLFYEYSPRTAVAQEQAIIDISTSACGKTSQMLANVYQLGEDTGGELRDTLDDRGAVTADAAKALLTAAQLTAASVDEPRCQSVLIASANALSSSAHELANGWSPLLQNRKHTPLVKQLNQEHDELQKELNKLRHACQDIDRVSGQGDSIKPKVQNKEQQRLDYIASLEAAKNSMRTIDEEYNKPVTGDLLKGEAAVVRELQMSKRIAQLNSALAMLATAMTDRDNPNYTASQQVLNTINELMPQVVKDTKKVAESKDDKTRVAMMEDLRALIEATREICDSTEISPEKFNDIATKFGNASSKLTFVVNPRARPKTASQIIEITQAIHKNANQLVKDTNKLASDMNVAAAVDLVQCCHNTDLAANALLTAAQLTAPCINEPHSQSALASSADMLAASAHELSRRWAAIQDPVYKPYLTNLVKKHQQLLQDLDKLMSVCEGIGKGKIESVKRSDSKNKEQDQHQLIKTIADAKTAVMSAEKELNKPLVGSSPKGEAAALQGQQLSQRLAQLNAAVAALVKATADRKNPDHVAAEAAVATIKQLMPQVVKNANGLTAGKDEASRAAALAELRALCHATLDICDNAEKNNTTELNESAMKFANSSNKLFHEFSPRTHVAQEQAIIDISTSACGKTSQMLANVYQLGEDTAGELRDILDDRGAVTADAAKALLTAVQLTAASADEPRCQSVLIASANALSSSAHELANGWSPLLQNRKHTPLVKQLNQEHDELQKELNKLRNACQDIDRVSGQGDSIKPKLQNKEQQRLDYTASLEAAKNSMRTVDEEYNKPVTGDLLKGEAAVVRELQMSKRIAQLNAALAMLATAMTDRDNPNYTASQEVLNTINELMPQVVKDTKKMAESKDEKTRVAMMEDLRALIEATREICDGTDIKPEKFNDIATKFGNASSKLTFVVNPRAQPNTASEIIGIAQAAHKSANQLVKDTNKLASEINVAAAVDLVQCCHNTDLAANALLTAAQLTAPCINEPRCQTALATSADMLAASAHELSRRWALIQDPIHKPYLTSWVKKHQQLLHDLDKLMSVSIGKGKFSIVKSSPSPAKEQDKLQFTNTAANAKKAVIAAEKELDKPFVGSPPKGEAATLQRQQLSQGLSKLNAALAALAAATADHKNPDHVAAEKAIAAIKELMPNIVKNANALTADNDEATKATARAELRAVCEAVRDICDNAQIDNTAKLHDCVSQRAVGPLEKLYYVFNSNTNMDKQNEMVDLSKSISSKASQLTSEVYHLAHPDNKPSSELDIKVAGVAEATNAILTAVQLTGPYIHEAEGQSRLNSSSNALSAAAKDLMTVITPTLKNPRCGPKIREAHQGLETELEKLRRVCRNSEKDESIVHKTVNHKGKAPLPNKMDTKSHDQFVKSVEDSGRVIHAAKEDIKKMYNEEGAINPSADRDHLDQVVITQKNLENILSQVNSSAATLLACNTPDSMDFATASKTTNKLATLMPEMVKEAKVLAKSLADEDRKAFLGDILALFDSAKTFCDVAGNDRKKLNESAVDFGNKSAKLLYAVSTDLDSNNEKEVIMRAKEIGDNASRLAMCSAKLVNEVDKEKARELCAAGGRCADAAGTLVYTAKLVAPSIQNPDCQTTLKTATQTLSSQLKSFSTAWQSLPTNPQLTGHIQQLSSESTKLEKLLDGLREDIERRKLVVKKVKLVVEDTPLRMLASAILDNAEMQLNSSTISPEQRRAYVQYAKALNDAIKNMDIANAVCKMNPHDLEKRRTLEDAVQDLQIVTLQMRPAQGDKPKNNIVDLTDFVKDLSSDVEDLAKATDNCASASQGIKDCCNLISTEASRVMNPDNIHNVGEGTTMDGISEVDRLGWNCAKQIKKLNTEIEKLDPKDKNILSDKITNLQDSCNILRFATQSAIATAQSASLEETLNDLTDLGYTIEQMLAAGDLSPRLRGACVTEPIPWSVRSNLLTSARNGAAHPQLAASLAAYVDEQRVRTDLCDPAEKNKLKEHLKNVLHLVRIMTVTSSRRVATWQEVDGPELASATELLLKEIDAACDKKEQKKGDKSVLQNIDINKLLLSSDDVKVEGDRKHVEDKLQQTTTKLSSMLATVVASAQKPDSLTRSLHVTADAATNLAALARALKKENDPTYNAKIEEATREMTLNVYNVLKASELVSQDPNNPVYRRKLLDACRLLNEALNKLNRTTAPGSKLQRDCNELMHNMQLQQSLLQGVPQPTSSMSYSDCVDALHSQQEVIQKLNNDQPMSRQELSKTLSYVTSAVGNSTEIAMQCAYFLVLSERDKEAASAGVVDVERLRSVVESTQNICYRILRTEPAQVKEEEAGLVKQVDYLKQAVTEAAEKSKHLKEELTDAAAKMENAAKELQCTVTEKMPDRVKVTSSALKLLDTIKMISSLTEHPSLVPMVSNVSTDAQLRCDDVLKTSRGLTSKTLSLVREVKIGEERDPMTWVMFNTSRKDVLEMFETLINSVKENGKRAGLLEPTQSELEEDLEAPQKSYVETQLEIANRWLKRPSCKPEIKSSGEMACQKVVDIAEKMANELKGAENEEICHLIAETKELQVACSKKHDAEKSRLLIERLKELRKCIERGVVTMVVEDFIEGEEPLADLEVLVDAEKDETKRKFLLERKIAELLAQLGRVTKTARFVADSGNGGQTVNVELKKCSDQAELLAPMLVKAAQERVSAPNDTAIIESYKSLLAQYAESLSKVRDLCDRSVDPMDFVQTAGETMEKMREESTQENDPYKCAYTSTAISKLANRVIHVSMSSNNVKRDPELRRALAQVEKRISAAVPSPNTRRSKLPDWRVTTAEILRTTGEVESVLGGEIIFQKQPEPDQPIFAAAAGLHAAVRDWSARDNEIVAVAKRMAVLMAKLSEYMNTNKKRELIATSKSIAIDSQEVAELARKLAHECTDVRIKTNLLKTCEKIPTISGQLKMLTTVKGSSLGHQGSKEDQEDINMLVDNAQNLMLSIQEVVKVAAGASVKIMSQRGGPRVRWVRKNYYY